MAFNEVSDSFRLKAIEWIIKILEVENLCVRVRRERRNGRGVGFDGF